MSVAGYKDRKVYSFKSVGEKPSLLQTRDEVSAPARLPIGIKTPIQLVGEGGFFQMHFDNANQIADNLRNLILTNHGERLVHYDFGANLRALTFNLGQEQFDNEAILRIKRAVNKYMPYVSLETFVSFVEHNDLDVIATVGIRITYRVEALDETTRVLEIILYAGG